MNKPVVICIDDESTVLDSLKIELKKILGFEYGIEVAKGGIEALELLDEIIEEGQDVAVVISDYIMPGMKGVEVLKNVHQRSPNTYNIMLTGQADIDAVTHAINEARLFHYITKPWTSEDIRTCVLSALGSYNKDRQIAQQNHRLRAINLELNKTIEQRDRTQVELIKAKEAAESANQSKSKFLAHMSHELRTPLNAILGFSQLLERDNSLSLKHLEMLSIINQNGKHLLGLINEVLTMAKIEVGQAQLNLSHVSIGNLLKNLVKNLGLSATVKGIKLDLIIDPNAADYVLIDALKLEQILNNLVGNAIKFTDYGHIKIHYSSSCFENSDEIELKFLVQDTGPGIPQDQLQNLFDMFTQVDVGTQAREGAGLGLSICKEFVNLMGGDIKVDSIFGEGTSINFNIFADKIQSLSEDHTDQREVIKVAVDGQKYRILIAEDHQESRQFLNHLLTTIGFDVKEAKNGQEAINTAYCWQPNLVLMDMSMPIIDGHTATRQIKSLPNPPIVIAITANVFESDEINARKSGCDDFIRKPYLEKNLFNKISKHLGVSYYLESESTYAKPVNDENLTPEELTVMPNYWLQQLRLAAMSLDAQTIQNKLLSEISFQHSKLKDKLDQLTQKLKFEKIVELSKTAYEINHSIG